jgi:hypothetical protein
MFEEIKYAYAIAKKLKAVEWEVCCHETSYGEYKAFHATSKEYGTVWIASGPDFLRPWCNVSDVKLCGLDKLSWIGKRVIWYFGGFSDICDDNFISQRDNQRIKMKKVLDNLK